MIPSSHAPYAARGQSLIATNQYPKAIEDYNAALNVNNKDATSWAYRGLAYEKSGQRKEAMENYQRASVIDPNNSVARAGLGRVQGGVGSLFN